MKALKIILLKLVHKWDFEHCHSCTFEEFAPSLPFCSHCPKISTVAALERKILLMNNVVTILGDGRGGNCFLRNMFRHSYTFNRWRVLMGLQCLWKYDFQVICRVELPIIASAFGVGCALTNRRLWKGEC